MKKNLLLILVTVLCFRAFAQTWHDSINVVHYDIHLRIDLPKKFIQGTTYLKITSDYNLDSIKLNLWGLLIDTVKVNGQKIDSIRLRTQMFSVPYRLAANDTITMAVSYHGNPLKDPFWGGFSFSDIDAYNYGIGMHSKPVSVARVWFPANDCFTDKATFDFYITTDTNLQAVCNGLLMDTTHILITKHIKVKIPDKQTGKLRLLDTISSRPYVTWHWKLNLPIPPYLANVGVSNYKHWHYTYKGLKNNIPVDIYLLPYNTVDNAKKSFVHLDSVMKIFETLYGPYPWPRIGYLETTMQYGAMEHVTNISLPEHVIDGSLKSEDLFYHELSHSWFGDLVTCDKRQDMWLNEGWAEYSQAVFHQYLYGEKNFKDYNRERHLMVLNFAHKKDGGYKALANIDFDNTYGTTIYEKGADIVHTLRYQIGDSLFWPAIRAYLQHFAFKNASINDLQNFLSQETNMNLKPFFDFFVRQPGFTYIEIYDYSTKKVNGKYQTALVIKQRSIGTDTVPYNLKLQIGLAGPQGQWTIRNLTVNGRWTYDTVVTDFQPVTILPDPNEYIADATTDQTQHITQPDNYYYDYELAQIYVDKVKKPVILRIQANWLPPDGRFPDGYLVQKNYYWQLFTNASKHFQAMGKFYLSTLMDINFTHLTQKDLKNLVMFYRAKPYEPWQVIPSKISDKGDALIIMDLKPGQYALGLKR